jgi:hypothetical protein
MRLTGTGAKDRCAKLVKVHQLNIWSPLARRAYVTDRISKMLRN